MALRRPLPRLGLLLVLLGVRILPAPAADSAWVIVGSGPAEKDRAELLAYKPDKTLALQLFPFDDYKKPPAMEIAAGDINGDGHAELIVAGGREDKTPAMVRAFDLKKAKIWELLPYADLKKDDDQIAVAAGDLDGDGNDELITGEASDSKGPNRLRIFGFQEGKLSQLAEFPIADLKNVALAAGDLDGDGKSEILVANARAAGKGPDLRILKAQSEGGWKLIQTASFSPLQAKQSFRIGAGDINGDKKDEILVAFEPFGKDEPSCVALDGSGKILLSLAAPFKHKNHLRVSAADLNNDGKEEILLAHVKPEGENESDGFGPT